MAKNGKHGKNKSKDDNKSRLPVIPADSVQKVVELDTTQQLEAKVFQLEQELHNALKRNIALEKQLLAQRESLLQKNEHSSRTLRREWLTDLGIDTAAEVADLQGDKFVVIPRKK
jgi:hypothetical protein